MLIIDDIEYTNITTLKEKIRQIFYDVINKLEYGKEYQINSIHEYFKALKKLAKTKPEKINNRKIKKFIVKHNPWNRKTFHTEIHFKNGEHDDISFLHCCQLIFNKKTNDKIYDLNQCLRKSIAEQIISFRNKRIKENKYYCVNCSQDGGKLEIDHVIKFRNLVKDFLKQKNNEDYKIIDDLEYGGCKFENDQCNYSLKWKEYHKQNARLRVLCKQCNLYEH